MQRGVSRDNYDNTGVTARAQSLHEMRILLGLREANSIPLKVVNRVVTTEEDITCHKYR